MRNKRPNYHNHMAAYSYASYNAYQVKCTRINLGVIANTHSEDYRQSITATGPAISHGQFHIYPC